MTYNMLSMFSYVLAHKCPSRKSLLSSKVPQQILNWTPSPNLNSYVWVQQKTYVHKTELCDLQCFVSGEVARIAGPHPGPYMQARRKAPSRCVVIPRGQQCIRSGQEPSQRTTEASTLPTITAQNQGNLAGASAIPFQPSKLKPLRKKNTNSRKLGKKTKP